MFVKGNTVYADAYKYLRHKTRRIVALSFKGSADDFDEVDMTLPIEVKIDGDMIFWQNKLLAARPEKMEYASIKEKIIKSRYTYDEQLAIMLNNGKSENDNMLYNKMQEWRDFATTIARLTENKINEK